MGIFANPVCVPTQANLEFLTDNYTILNWRHTTCSTQTSWSLGARFWKWRIRCGSTQQHAWFQWWYGAIVTAGVVAQPSTILCNGAFERPSGARLGCRRPLIIRHACQVVPPIKHRGLSRSWGDIDGVQRRDWLEWHRLDIRHYRIWLHDHVSLLFLLRHFIIDEDELFSSQLIWQIGSLFVRRHHNNVINGTCEDHRQLFKFWFTFS